MPVHSFDTVLKRKDTTYTCIVSRKEFNIFRDGVDPAEELDRYASHSTFARGRHFCIGSKLAGLEAEIAANQLLDAMDDIAFADGIAPKQEGNFVRAPRSFPVTFTPT